MVKCCTFCHDHCFVVNWTVSTNQTSMRRGSIMPWQQLWDNTYQKIYVSSWQKNPKILISSNFQSTSMVNANTVSPPPPPTPPTGQHCLALVFGDLLCQISCNFHHIYTSLPPFFCNFNCSVSPPPTPLTGWHDPQTPIGPSGEAGNLFLSILGHIVLICRWIFNYYWGSKCKWMYVGGLSINTKNVILIWSNTSGRAFVWKPHSFNACE